jgi:aspartyl-tRNA(Asn)/glutamyl-tRNA(Gln) amidotransferase subunit A
LELADLSILELSAAVRRRECSCEEVARGALSRIASTDVALQAFRETYADLALERARMLDEIIAAGGDPGPLAGVPIALKDNIATAFGRTSCGSRMLEEYRSPFSATAVERLLAAGAVVVGKTRCDEFAMGSSTESCAFGPARNPWDPARVPGGSSGGSAAAVAARLCPGALGSETGGSIRQPAAMCGVVGVKPSYGRVSRWGLVAFGSSLDQVGPIAAGVRDAALLLQVIAGPDRRDATSAPHAVPDYLAGIDDPPRDLRIGVPRQHLGPDNDPAVNDAVTRAVEHYARLGAEPVELDMPLAKYAIATYYILAPAEASSNLARYDGVRYGRRARIGPKEDLFDLYARSRAEGFGPEVKRRIMLGTYVLSAGYHDAFYSRALKVRRLIRQEYDRAFDRCDAIIGPTAPAPAFRLGEKGDPLAMYLCDLYTTNANVAGVCALSLPCGFARAGAAELPVGLQVQCRAFDEATMFKVARMFEATTGHARPPPLTGTAPSAGAARGSP